MTIHEAQFPEVFDSSIMATMKSCWAKVYLESFSHWKPRTPSVHLHAGAAFAKGIEKAREAFYNQRASHDDSVAMGLRALLTAYGTFECPADSAKSCERMAGALEFYFTQFPMSEHEKFPITLPGGKRGIEFSFAHPLPINHPVTGNPLIYCGRLDAILDYAGGIFICDEKTTSQLGATWPRQWELRGQFTGYAWGCRQSGIKVDGAIVRGISILKNKYDCAEAITFRPAWQVDRWYDELCDWLTEAIFHWKRGKFKHNLDHSCAEYGGCTFRQVCQTQDTESWLTTQFEQRRWDPITRTETRLDGPAPEEQSLSEVRIDV